MGNAPRMPGGGGLKIIWENPAPDEPFSAQTISVPNVKKYKYILIGFRGTSGAISSAVISTSKQGTQYVVCTEHVVFVERNISVNTDALVFGDAIMYTTYGQAASAVNNRTAVPIVVLGIK